MYRAIWALTVAVLVTLTAATTATASTVEIVPGTPNALAIVGDPGNDDLEVRIISGEIRVEDAGVAGVIAGSGCAPDPGLDPHFAFCTLAGTGALDADLGTGNDHLFSFVACNNPSDPFEGNYSMDGGDGLDFLSGGAGNYSGGPEQDVILLNCADLGAGPTTIDGGDGDDIIDPTANQDTVVGGQGDDLFRDDVDNLVDITANRDSFDGGPGNDTVSYGNRTRKVVASLRTDRGGNRNEKDTYVGIENLFGGDFKDVLSGDDNDNVLNGRGGGDKLLGFGGNDELFAGTGPDDFDRDVLDGGLGDDLLNTVDGAAKDVLRCKAGNDDYQIDLNDRPGRDCENLLP